MHAKVQDNSTDWGTEKPTGEATVSGQPAEMDTWADKGAKMDSDAGDDNWEKSSSTPEASNKNQKIHGTKEKEMEVMVPGRRSLMMAMAIGSIPATGNARGKKKADGNWKCWRWN